MPKDKRVRVLGCLVLGGRGALFATATNRSASPSELSSSWRVQHLARRPFISGTLQFARIHTVQTLHWPDVRAALARPRASFEPVSQNRTRSPLPWTSSLQAFHLPFHAALIALPFAVHEVNSPPRERATWGVSRSHSGPGPSAQPLRRDSLAPQSWSQRSRSRASVAPSSRSGRRMVPPRLPHCPGGLETLPHWEPLLQGYMDSHLLNSRSSSYYGQGGRHSTLIILPVAFRQEEHRKQCVVGLARYVGPGTHIRPYPPCLLGCQVYRSLGATVSAIALYTESHLTSTS